MRYGNRFADFNDACLACRINPSYAMLIRRKNVGGVSPTEYLNILELCLVIVNTDLDAVEIIY